MTIEDIDHPEPQQRHEAALLSWFSKESGPGPVPLEHAENARFVVFREGKSFPEVVTNSPAVVRSVRPVIGGAGTGWQQYGDQLLAVEGRPVQIHQIRHLAEVPAVVEVYGAPARRPDLDAALADLAQVADEAREDGFDPPPELALRNADRLLRDMHAHRRCRFDVYPTPDREVAIYVLERERSVLVLCGPDGSVRCSVNLNGKHCRAYYDPAFPGGVPAGFLRDALAALDVA